MTLLRGAGIVIIAALAGACAHKEDASRPWVRTLVLHGVRHVDERDLRRHLVTEETAHFVWADKKPFDPFALRLDAATVESYYRAHGFFDARVTATDVNPADRPHAVNVEIFVDEGAATKIEQRQGRGARRHRRRRQARSSATSICARGRSSTTRATRRRRARCAQRLRTLGYAWAEVDGRRRRRSRSPRRRRDAQDRPGAARRPCATSRSQGAYEHRSQASYIKHSLLREGVLLTPEALETARAKLYNLGFLTTVRIDYRHNSLASRAGRRHARASPRGRSTSGASALGVSLELQRSELRGRAEYTRYHWLGGLRRLRLRAEPAYVFVPAFWNPLTAGAGRHRRGGADAARSRAAARRAARRRPATISASSTRSSITGRARRSATRATSSTTACSCRSATTFSTSCSSTSTRRCSADPALSARDYGFVDPYRVDLARAGGHARSARSAARHAPRRLVLAARRRGRRLDRRRLRLREARRRGARLLPAVAARWWSRRAPSSARSSRRAANGTPTTRRFYLGGPESHRGFNFNRLSLQIPSGTPGNPALPVGGDEMFLTQIEVRVRAVRLYGSWLEVASFLDAGDVAGADGLPFDHIDLARAEHRRRRRAALQDRDRHHSRRRRRAAQSAERLPAGRAAQRRSAPAGRVSPVDRRAVLMRRRCAVARGHGARASRGALAIAAGLALALLVVLRTAPGRRALLRVALPLVNGAPGGAPVGARHRRRPVASRRARRRAARRRRGRGDDLRAARRGAHSTRRAVWTGACTCATCASTGRG